MRNEIYFVLTSHFSFLISKILCFIKFSTPCSRLLILKPVKSARTALKISLTAWLAAVVGRKRKSFRARKLYARNAAYFCKINHQIIKPFATVATSIFTIMHRQSALMDTRSQLRFCISSASRLSPENCVNFSSRVSKIHTFKTQL